MTLGEKIRQARIERGMTQKQLVGEHITRNMLSKIENGSATPSMRTLEFLSQQLGLPASYFLSDFTLSDGTSPDGLDNMRQAYREGRYLDCIELLEASKTAGSTDEGYLLHALACIGAAKEATAAGDIAGAKEYADAADYYNKQGLYYDVKIDAEMSLILAECSLILDISDFEKNAQDYESAIKNMSYSNRFALANAEYLIRTGETELAKKQLENITNVEAELQSKLSYVRGLYLMHTGNHQQAIEELKQAEKGSSAQMEDYKGAYYYASKQLHND
jgi:transcriptional regulator with XRE-family HTH domain